MEDNKETITEILSPEEAFEKYLANIKTQIEGKKIEGRGIGGNSEFPFGATKKDAERVLKKLQNLGYELRWSEKRGEHHWVKDLIDPFGFVCVQLFDYPRGSYKYSYERTAAVIFHPGGRGEELNITGEEEHQKIAKEALKLIHFFLNEKIPFSTLDTFFESKPLGEWRVLRVDFPEGKKKISVVPFEI